MKRWLAVVTALFAIGCAQDFVPSVNDLSVRDFSPGDASGSSSMDLSGVGPSLDLSMNPSQQDLSMPDLAMPDLTTPPDLTPILCDLSSGNGDGGTVPRLYLAAVAPSNSLATASFTAAAGWSTVAVDSTAAVSDVDLTIGPGAQPLVVARQSDTKSTLAYSLYSPCAGVFPPLAPLFSGASTSLRPALAGGATTDVVFRGFFNSDNHLYHSTFDGSSWTAATQLALLTNVIPSVTRQGSVLDVIHTGTTGTVYDAPIGSTTIATTGSSSLAPATVTGLDGTIYVVFTGMDTNLYFMSRASGVASYAAPAKVCPAGTCLATSADAPVLALTVAGNPIVAFLGTDQHVYTSTLTGTTWSSPIAAMASGDKSPAHLLPALATGLGDADAELVYVRDSDNYARHARLQSGSWGSVTSVGTIAISTTPALASQR